MPLENLREIAGGLLPPGVNDQDKIDKLRMLLAVDMVWANLPEVGQSGGGLVQSLTGSGRAWLKARPFKYKAPGARGSQCC